MAHKPLTETSGKENTIVTEKYIQLQNQEYELKMHELEIRCRQNENNYEFAKESLRLQSEDLKDMRNHEIKKEKRELIIICSTIFAFFIIVLLALFMNKDELLGDLIKAVGFIFGGGITGYGMGLQKGKVSSKSFSKE